MDVSLVSRCGGLVGLFVLFLITYKYFISWYGFLQGFALSEFLIFFILELNCILIISHGNLT